MSIFPAHIERRLDEERHTLSPADYLERTKIMVYLQDALAQLQDAKEERSLTFLAKYFAALAAGEHIVFREFRFVNATPHNRRHFVDLFRRTFSHMQPTDGARVLEINDALLRLASVILILIAD